MFPCQFSSLISAVLKKITSFIARYILYHAYPSTYILFYGGTNCSLHKGSYVPTALTMDLSHEQLRALTIVERCASTLSILGVVTIIGLFSFSRHFRNPIQRIIFINAFYNLFDFIATMISLSGPDAGNNSALCQFQAFCLQMCVQNLETLL